MLLTFIMAGGIASALGAAPAAASAAAPAAPVAGARAPLIPLRDFFRNPEKVAFALSDDGKWVSYLAPNQSRLNIFVRPADKAAATRITDESARDIASYFWKGSDTLVYVKDFGGDENFHLVSVTRDGKTTKDLTPFPKVRAEIVDDLRDDPSSVLVGLNKRNPEIFDVYRVNVRTGELTLVAENPGNITSWYADHTGQIRLATTTDGVNNSLLYRADAKAPFKTVLTTTFRDSVAPQFFTFDNAKVYAASNLSRDKQALVVIDPTTAKEEKVLFPWIRAGRGASARAPIKVMQHEHQQTRELLARLRTLSERSLAEEAAAPSTQTISVRLAAIESALLEHMDVEESLFRRVLAS
mgnify:CR=1 FL=1